MAKMFGVAPVTEKDVGGDSGEDAAKDLLEAIRDRDPAAILSAFKLLYGHCADEGDDDGDDEEDSKDY